MKPHFTETRLYASLLWIGWVVTAAAALLFLPLRLLQLAGELQ